jgi:hypothetical protein
MSKESSKKEIAKRYLRVPRFKISPIEGVAMLRPKDNRAKSREP